MIIDFHTHTFPDQIASRAITKLSEASGLAPYTDGTLSGLLQSMDSSGTDCSVILPVMTNPSQFGTINHTAMQVNEQYGDRVISFGAIHPDCDHIYDKLRQIQEMGLKGIKLHPDYQHTYIDDSKNLEIIRTASDLGLITVIHAGVDVGYPKPVHCSPKATRNMIDLLHPKNLVLAHMGGCDLWEEVEEYLVGLDVYFDTSFIYYGMRKEKFINLARKHGIERILYATDSPWCSQRNSMEWISNCGLSSIELQQILSENAQKLLL